MSDKDLFDEEKKDENTPDLTKDEGDKGGEGVDQLLKSITNDDGTPKYASEAEALKALAHAQDHIKTLEADNASLKDKGDASEKLDELLAAVKQSKDSGQGESGDNASTLGTEDVLTIVKEYLDDTKAAESRTSNIKTVTNLFKSRYGKDASEKLYGKAADLGLGKSEINSMIAANPNAALRILGEDVKKEVKQDPTVMKSGVSAANFQGKPEEKPASIMGLSSSKDLTDAWVASKQKTLKRLGIES